MPLHPNTVNGIANLAMKMAGNPKTRADFFKAAKTVDPSFRTPADVEMENFRRQQKREREEEKIKEKAERLQERQAEARAGLLNSGKYNEDQIKEIEALMQKHGLADYDAGTKLYAADTSPARPSGRDRPRHGQIWEFPDLPGLLQNPDKAATDMAYQVIDELRGR